MSRSRHLRRILAAGVVASVSITWGAGVAFATDSPSPIDQSNDINVNASVGTCEPGYPENPTADEVPVRCVNDAAIANSGKNLQGNEGQANITGQAAVSVGVGHQHHGDDDAFALGLYFGALALGGDGFAIATNKANSDNNADVTNHLQTGAAEAKNTLAVDGSQSNKNTGDSVVVGLGSGAAGISQSNGLAAIGDNNLALANTGKNIQGSGGQLNLTGQLALAGAAGSSALALSLGVGIAAGGNAFALASNSSGHACCPDPGQKDNYSNYQTVDNWAKTGDATAVNAVQIGTPDDPKVDGDQSHPFSQSNENRGDAYAATGLAYGFGFAGAFIVQQNAIYVDGSYNAAVANSGLNLQGSGPQLNGTLQIAGAGAAGGWGGAAGLLGLGLAFGGDGKAIALNHSDSANYQQVTNHLETGDATAVNYVGVLATQSNENHGNAGALQILSFAFSRCFDVVLGAGLGIGGIVQVNDAEIGSAYNFALANTGANGQFGGFQGNGTIQGAGALGVGGWAGALGALAFAHAGDGTAIAGNHANSVNDSHVSNWLQTGDAIAQNWTQVDLTQTNKNKGWAAGVAAIDAVGIGIGFIYQQNSAEVDSGYNTAIANSGANAQGTLGQGNLTLQGSGALAGGGSAISLGLLAGAKAGDGTAIAGNKASSSNSQKVDNKATTGEADASNISFVNVGQSNDNGGHGRHDGDVAGIVALAGIGIGVGVIIQTNSVEVYSGYNTAVANSGANAQFGGPQVNITGQLALAGAGGGGALGLGLIGAGAVGGDAFAGAFNFATSTNWAQICNELTTGIANATNLVALSVEQSNKNKGDAKALVIAEAPVVYAGAISQSNSVEVSNGDNTAVANSGANVQGAGAQVNVTVQVAADGAVGGGSAAAGGLGAVAIDGDAGAVSANSAGSVNTVDVSNNMTTGDATALNQTVVDVTQQNENHGDAEAVGL